LAPAAAVRRLLGSSAAASPSSCATATVTSAAVAAAAVFTFSPALNPHSFSPPSPPLFLLRAPYFSSPFRLLRSPAAAAASQPSPLHPFHRRLWPLVRRSPPPPHHRPAAAFPGPHTASPPGPGNPRARVLITATPLSLSRPVVHAQIRSTPPSPLARAPRSRTPPARVSLSYGHSCGCSSRCD